MLKFVQKTSVTDARKNIKTWISHVADNGTRLAITNHGEAVVAMVPVSDLTLLEKQDMAAIERIETLEMGTPETDAAVSGKVKNVIEATSSDEVSSTINDIIKQITAANLLSRDKDITLLKAILMWSLTKQGSPSPLPYEETSKAASATTSLNTTSLNTTSLKERSVPQPAFIPSYGGVDSDMRIAAVSSEGFAGVAMNYMFKKSSLTRMLEKDVVAIAKNMGISATIDDKKDDTIDQILSTYSQKITYDGS